MTQQVVLERYTHRYETVLRTAARDLSRYIEETLSGTTHIDRISARAKSPDRFLAKAFKSDDDGRLKYSDPLNEIQDQIGARITVFYLSDVEIVRKIVLDYFTHIEEVRKEPERNSEFGYFGQHFILKLPDDVVPENLGEAGCPEFFELQIKTLFQHAWSEADHDLAYKSVRSLSQLEQRELAFSAAQAWGADRIFEELAKKLAVGGADG